MLDRDRHIVESSPRKPNAGEVTKMDKGEVKLVKFPSAQQLYDWNMEVFHEDREKRWYVGSGWKDNKQCQHRTRNPRRWGGWQRCEFAEGHEGPCDFE